MTDANEIDVFSKADAEMYRFLNQNLNQYSQLRNFDFGPHKHCNVSQLSKYISHESDR